jgi:hypothetical protein
MILVNRTRMDRLSEKGLLVVEEIEPLFDIG